MRLLHTKTLQFETFKGNKIPPYSILSHTWGEDETTYQAYKALLSQNLFTCLLSIYSDRPYEFLEILKADGKLEVPGGLIKILKFCQLARAEHCEWAWVDTCCIDKESSAELSEAINSMFRWYQQAQVCWAHLADVDDDKTPADKADPSDATSEGPPNEQNGEVDDQPKVGTGYSSMPWRPRRAPKGFAESKWFTRGWTLQELLAPTDVKFCSKNWSFIGSKIELSSEISEITGIDVAILGSSAPTQKIAQRPIAEKMSWAASRETTRVEDVAYSLLGIFDIHMSLLYGEGEKAFLRLQRKILKTSSDETIFAWDIEGVEEEGDFHGILASHPRAFRNAGNCVALEMNCDPVALTSRGAGFKVYNHAHLGGKTLRTALPLNCKRDEEVVGIFLAKLGGVWYRVNEPELSTHGLHNIGYSSAERFLPSTYTVREPLYVSMSSSPVPTTDLGIGIDQRVDADAFESTVDSDQTGINVNERTLATFVAIRFTTHFIPWPSLVRSVDVSTANKMIEHHPAIMKFQGRRTPSGLVEMTDTGKEVVVDPQSISPLEQVPSVPLLDSKDRIFSAFESYETTSAFDRTLRWAAEDRKLEQTSDTENVDKRSARMARRWPLFGAIEGKRGKKKQKRASEITDDNFDNPSAEYQADEEEVHPALRWQAEDRKSEQTFETEKADKKLDGLDEEWPIVSEVKAKKTSKDRGMHLKNNSLSFDQSTDECNVNERIHSPSRWTAEERKFEQDVETEKADESLGGQDEEEYPVSTKESKSDKKKKKKLRQKKAGSNLDELKEGYQVNKGEMYPENADSSLDKSSEVLNVQEDTLRLRTKKAEKESKKRKLENSESIVSEPGILDNSARITNSVKETNEVFSPAFAVDTEGIEFIAELAGWKDSDDDEQIEKSLQAV